MLMITCSLTRKHACILHQSRIALRARQTRALMNCNNIIKSTGAKYPHCISVQRYNCRLRLALAKLTVGQGIMKLKERAIPH